VDSIISAPADAPFSPRRAFVVQFRTTAGALTGRAEHIASGDAAFFSDQHDLLEFFSRVLNALDHDR
jgi:hypothetical protein